MTYLNPKTIQGFDDAEEGYVVSKVGNDLQMQPGSTVKGLNDLDDVIISLNANQEQTFFEKALQDVDGNLYDVVILGDQVWMAQNLRTSHYADGSEIPLATSESSDSLPYYYKKNVPEEYGFYYNKCAVLREFTAYPGKSSNPSGVQGVAPNGWHIPSKSEFQQMLTWVGQQPEYILNNDSTCIAKALASQSGWDTNSTNYAVGNDLSANNATKFNALPAGFVSNALSYYGIRCQIAGTNVGAVDNACMYTFCIINSSTTLVASSNFQYSRSDAVSVRCVFDGTPNQFRQLIVQKQMENQVLKNDGVYWKNVQYKLNDISDVNIKLETDNSKTYYEKAVKDYDGNWYDAVILGDQVWMAENLKTTHYADGTAITQGTTSTTSLSTSYYAYPYNDESYVETRGLLYNGYAMTLGSTSTSNPSNIKGIAPTGWHVPSKAEYLQLQNYLRSDAKYWADGQTNTYIAKAMASTNYWDSSDIAYSVGNDLSKNNVSKFNLVPTYQTEQLTHLAICDNINGYLDFMYNSYDTNFSTNYVDSSGNTNKTVRCVFDGSVEDFRKMMQIIGNDDKLQPMDNQLLKYDSSNNSWTNDYAGLNELFDVDLYFIDYNQTYFENVVQDYDGNWYNAVIIGDQIWMTENLKTTHWADGTAISYNTGSSTSNMYYRYPGDNASNVEEFGLLYNSYAVSKGVYLQEANDKNPSDIQGIAPGGWHIPSRAEWQQLILYMQSKPEYWSNGQTSTYIAKAMASKEYWQLSNFNYYVGNDLSKNNASGLNLIPAGRDASGINQRFSGITVNAPSGSTTDRYFFNLAYNDASVNTISSYTDGGVFFSVRCLYNDSVDHFRNLMLKLGKYNKNNEIKVNDILKYNGEVWTNDKIKLDELSNVEISPVSNLKKTYYKNAVQDYDGNWYDATIIGDQVWLAQNLRTTHYADGTAIDDYKHVNKDAGNDEMLGLMYNYNTYVRNASSSDNVPSGVQGIAPNGWHIPSKAETNILKTYLVSTHNSYKPIASKSMWTDSSVDNTPGYQPELNNSTGMNLYPTGYINSSNVVGNFKNQIILVTSTLDSSQIFWSIKLNYNTTEITTSQGTALTTNYYTVRCLYDGTVEEFRQKYANRPSDKQILRYDLENEKWINVDLDLNINSLDGVDINLINDDSQRYFKEALTDYDGNLYDVVIMGDQVWMAQNLRTKHYADGFEIPMYDSSLSGSSTDPCYYENKVSTNVYGLYYNVRAALRGDVGSDENPSGVQGVAPHGWHIPSRAEFNQMIAWVKSQPEYLYNDNINYYGKSLASTFGWSGSGVSTGDVGSSPLSNNKTGFNLIPTGYYYGQNIQQKTNKAYLHTSSIIDSFSYKFILEHDEGGSNESYGQLSYDVTYPVRCVYDGSPEDFIKELEKNNYFKYDVDSKNWINSKISLNDLDDVELSINEIDTTTNYFENAVTDIDGNSYDVVILGDQVWTAENLIANHYADGTSIANHTENSELYFPASIIENNMAPEGWHVASEFDWKALDNWVYNQNYSVSKAKAVASTSNWSSSSTQNTPGYNQETNNVTRLGLGLSTPNTTYAYYVFSDSVVNNGNYSRAYLYYNSNTIEFNSTGPQTCAIRCLYNGSVSQFLKHMAYKNIEGQLLKYDKDKQKWVNGEISIIPKPTAEDAGKVISVDDSGNYVLIDVTNSENVQY